MKPTASKRKTSLTAEEAADLSYFADNEQDPSMPPPAEKKERVDVTPLSNNLAEKIKQMVDGSATSEKTTYAVLSAQGSLIQALENQGLKLKPMVLEPSQKMLSINDPTVLMKDAPKVLTKLATVKVDAELQGELQQLIKAHYGNPDVHDELMEVFEKKQQQEITARNNTLNTNATIIDIEKRKDKQGNVSCVLTTVDEHGISYQVLEKANMKDLKLKIGNDINIQGVTMEKVDSLTGERKFAIKPTTQQVSLINTTQNTVKVEPPVQPKPGSGKSVMMTNKAEPPVQPEPGLVKSVMMNIKVEPPVQPEPAAPAVEVAKDAPSILYIAKQEAKQSFDFNNGNTNIEGRVRMDVNPDYMQLRKGDSPEILMDFHTEAKDLDHDTYLTLKVVAGDENSLTEGVYFSASGSSNFGMSGKVNSQTFEGAMNEIADALEKDATFNWAVGNDAGMLDVIREFGKTAAPTYLSEQEISQFQEQRAEIQKIKALDNITENQAIKKFNEPPAAPAVEVAKDAPSILYIAKQEAKQSFDFNNGNTNIEGRVRMDVNPDYMQLRKGDSPEILMDFHTEAKDLDHDTYLTLKVVAGDENSLTEGVYFSASGSSNFGMSGKVNSQTFEGAMNEIADALEKDATFNWAVGNDAGMLDVIREFGKTAAPTYLSEQEISQFQEQRAEIQKIKALDNITENQAIKKFNEPPAAPAAEVAKDAPSILYIAKQEAKQSFDFNNGNTNIEGRVRMDVNPDYMQLRKGDSPEILMDFHTEAKDLDHDTYLTLKVVAGDENSLTEGVYFSASGSSNFGMSGKVNSQTFEGAMNEIADALEKDATFNWAVGNDAGMLDVIREFGKTAAPTYLSEQEISQFQEQRAEIQKIKALDNITENQAIKKFNEPPAAPAAEVAKDAPSILYIAKQEAKQSFDFNNGNTNIEGRVRMDVNPDYMQLRKGDSPEILMDFHTEAKDLDHDTYLTLKVVAGDENSLTEGVYFSASGSSNFGMSGKVNSQTFEGAMNEIADALEKDATFNWAVGNDAGMLDVIREFGKTAAPTYLSEQEISQFQEQRAEIQKIKALDNITENQAIKKFNEPPAAPAAEVTQGVTAPEVNVVETQEPTPAKTTKVEEQQPAPQEQRSTPSYGTTIEEVKEKLESTDFSMNVELSNKLREQNAEAPSAKFMKLMEINDGDYHVMPSIKRFDSEKQKVGMKSITDLEKMPFANDAEKMEAYANQIESRVAFMDKIENGELDFSPKNLTTTQGFVPTYNINKNSDSMRLGAYTSGIKGDNVKIEVPTRDSYAVIYGKVNSLNDTAPSKTDHIIVNTGEKVTDSMLFAEVDKNVDKSNLAIVHIPPENIKNVLGKLMTANPKSKVTMIIDNNAQEVDFTAEDSLGREISSKKAGDVIERVVVEQAINNDKISVVRLNEKFGHSFTNVYEQVLKQVSQNKQIDDPKDFTRKALGNVIESSKQEGEQLVQKVKSIADIQPTVANDKDNTQALEQGKEYKPNRYMKI